MARTEQQTIALIKQALGDHKDYWQSRQADMRRLRSAYLTRFFEDGDGDDSSIRVETSDAYTFIESYIASLFEKSPAVEADSMKADADNVQLARQCVNNWIARNRKALENGSRLSLIYPMAFFKLAPRESDDPLQRVSIRALEPWTVILDRDADLWDEQRYCGHCYFLPLTEAKKKWGGKKFKPVSKPAYFDETGAEDNTGALPDDFKYVEIVEFYSLLDDMLYIFSPNLGEGSRLLDKRPIPLRHYDDTPAVPLVPLYYSRVPDKPLDGYSALSRVYDQLAEKNIMRTFWANAIRRDSRQYLVREGAMDEDALAKITAGVDGAIIPVDTESLDGVIRSVPVEPMTGNFDRYAAAIESDIQRGSIISANTRGEATKATATEVAALSQYTASEIGRLARERDEAIEMIATIFCRMMVYTLKEDEKPVILVKKKPQFVTADKLDGDYRFFALDQAATPLSNDRKRRQLLELLPVLGQLGVDPEKIKKEVIRLFDLPEVFLEGPEEQEVEAVQPTKTAEAIPADPASDAEALANELIQRQQSVDIAVPQ